MVSPLEAFEPPFMQTAALELLLLSVAGGLVGTWIVLRRLAFFAHAVGTATFPGLVVAEAASFSPQLAGLAVALGYAGGLERVRGERDDDSWTGLLLVGAIALGVVLSSDLLEGGQSADRLLFGTLIGLTSSDVWWSAGAALAAAVATLALGRAWVATTFDPAGSDALGARRGVLELAMLALVGACIVAALPAVGALLVGALFVVPAATVRLLAPSVPLLLAGSVALAMVEGLVGLYVAYGLDVSPGPAVAVVAAANFALVAAVTRGRRT